jgi:3-oxoacyl-[acyl-carrier protein] reductase
MPSSKVILVTGAAGGIGSKIVETLSKSANRIIATDNSPKLSALFSNDSKLLPVECELTSDEQLNALITLCRKNYVNAVVHCAGYGGPFVKVTDVSTKEWDKVFTINVTSLFKISKALVPAMAKNSFGRIVAISSIQGNLGSTGSSAYVSSKHALNGLIKTIASEFGSNGITANAICPGFILSPMGASTDEYHKKVLDRTPTKTIGDPAIIAEMVQFMLSESSSYMNGSIVNIDGGISSDTGIF